MGKTRENGWKTELNSNRKITIVKAEKLFFSLYIISDTLNKIKSYIP